MFPFNDYPEPADTILIHLTEAELNKLRIPIRPSGNQNGSGRVTRNYHRGSWSISMETPKLKSDIPAIPMRGKKLILSLILLAVAVSGEAEDKADLEAISRLEDSIESLALDGGPFSSRLFDPLMELAGRQLDFGLTEDAVDTLHRAQNIAHRNEGVYTPSQLRIVEILTNLALKDRAWDDANRQKKFAFFVTRHAFEDDQPEVLSAFSAMGNWYMNTGQPRRARKLMQEARELAVKTGQDPLPFAILENRARRIEGLCCNPQKLIDALETSTFNHLPEVLIATYLEIADTLTLGGKSQRASEYFRNTVNHGVQKVSTPPVLLGVRRNLSKPFSDQSIAFRVIRDSPMTAGQRLRRLTEQQRLEEPNEEPGWFLVDPDGSHRGFSTRDSHESYDRDKRTYAMIGSPIMFSEDQLDQLLPLRLEKRKETLKIEISYNITETGDLENIDVIESNAPVKLNRLVTSALRKINYRPALVNGVPVATDNVTLVQTFEPRYGGSE